MTKRHDNVQETQIVYASNREKLYQNGKVFNIATFGPTLHVKIDEYMHRNFRLMRIYDVETSKSVERYDYDSITHPWIDIPVDKLNLTTGLHSYAIEFINLLTDDTFYQYFNYTIQRDKPAKPYIYMDHGDESTYVQYDPYEGDYDVVPSTSYQLLYTKGKVLNDDITVTPIPTHEVDNEAGVTFAIGDDIEGFSPFDFITQTKEVVPSEVSQTVTADEGYDGLGEVIVAPIPDEYIVPQGSKSIKANGEYDITQYTQVSVNVPQSGGGKSFILDIYQEPQSPDFVGNIFIDGIEVIPDIVTHEFEGTTYYRFEVGNLSLDNEIVYETDQVIVDWQSSFEPVLVDESLYDLTPFEGNSEEDIQPEEPVGPFRSGADSSFRLTSNYQDLQDISTYTTLGLHIWFKESDPESELGPR